jgi:hypothetical protein
LTKVVSIIGMESTSLAGADLDAKDGELWGLNAAFEMKDLEYAKWTRWFEMHAHDYLRRFSAERWDYCKSLKIPCYMLQHTGEVPYSRTYPRSEVNAYLSSLFGSEPDYFTSSFSYMIALALYEGFEEIRLYGVDLAAPFELALERAGAEYLIGLARGSGVKVTLSSASPMLYTIWPYGYEEPRITLSRTWKLVWHLMRLLQSMIAPPREYGSEAKTRASKARRIWLSTYGRPGTLLKPDGSVN